MRKKRALSLFLVLVMVLTMGSLVQVFAHETRGGQSKTSVVNLKTEFLTEADNLNDERPMFSWQMVSNEVGQCQTAYQIKVGMDDQLGELVWDSKKQEDSHSVGIKYEGDNLQSSTIYYWNVTVWDKDGNPLESETASFETELLGADAWKDSKWIQLGDSTEPKDVPAEINYTIEADLQIENYSVSLIFEAEDVDNYLMWQLNTTDGLQFKPHYRKNGGWNTIQQLNVSDIAIGNTTDPQNLKIAVTDDGITTYLNDQLISDIPARDLGGVNLSGPDCRLGFRSHSIDDERGWFDHIVVTDYSANPDGNIIKYYDFSDGVNPFDDGEVKNGRFYTKYTQFETVGLEQIPEGSGETDYTIEAEFEIENFSVSLLLEAKDSDNLLMWQFNTNGGMQFKPHYKKNGIWKDIQQLDVSQYVDGSNTSPQKIKIAVTAQGITTWLNGHQISDISATDLGGLELTGPYCRLGFRSDSVTDERGWLDNIVVTDYSKNSNGVVVKKYDFTNGVNPFDDGEVIDGRLYTKYTKGESYGLEPVKTAPRADVHYVVEAKVTCIKDAVSIIYNAADNKNFYMLQLNTKDNPGQILFKPHTNKDGNWTTYPSHNKNLVDVIGTPEEFANKWITIKIDVTEEEIKTYIEDVLVDTFPVSENRGIAPQIGFLGTRADLEEKALIDYMRLTDYSLSEDEGVVIYDYTFDNGENPFIKGTIENGAYVAHRDGIVIPYTGVPTFRKEFTPKEGLVSAKIYTTGLGVYDVYVDGERIGTTMEDGSIVYDELKPGYSHHSKRVLSNSYDISYLLQSGKTSAISAHVTSGWWSGLAAGHYGNNNGFRAQLLLTYGDGSQEVIGTDTTWKTSLEGPVLYGDIFNGEIYDANADISYRFAGYDDSEWYYADINKEFSGRIVGDYGTSIQIRDDLELTPVSATVYDGVSNVTNSQYGRIDTRDTYLRGETFTLNAGETAVFDMGQNFAGWGQISVEGSRGTVVKMRHGEMLNDNYGQHSRGNDGPEGSIYTLNLRSAVASAYYVLNGEGVETYHSSATYYGFQYLEVTASSTVKIHGMKGIVISSAVEDTGSIKTSDEDVNQLISNIFWGQYSNYVSVPTDCPQRDERKGWTADTQVFSTAAAYNSYSKSFLRKFMNDMNDSQIVGGRHDGAYPDTAPYNGYGGIGQLGWADAGIIVPYNLYKMYGDKAVIEENYESMKKFMDVFMASTNKMGGGHEHGDWLAYEENDDELMDMIGVAYYAWDAQMMAEMADIIGMADDAERYRAVYEDEKEHFQKLFVKPDGTLIRGEQTACLMALKMDLLPNEESRAKVKQMLLDNIARNGNKLQTGFLGTAVIMQTLSDIGANDIAYKLLLQRGNPSWLYSVDQGATTIWERWNSYTLEDGFGPVDMNSFNHYAYGAVAEWMYGYMAGIMYDVEEPGFKNIIFNPMPDPSIEYVDCSYDSVYGTITSNWKYEEEGFSYSVQIPANTTATIYVPTEGNEAVTVNGKAAENVTLEKDGLICVDITDETVVFEAVSGMYDFKAGEEIDDTNETDDTDETDNPADKKALKKLVEENTGRDPMAYPSDLWAVFSDILRNAEEILADDEATQEETDHAYNMLYLAARLLDDSVGVSVDKKAMLKVFIDAAEAVTDEELASVIPLVQKSFEKALIDAKAVYDKTDASDEEIEKAAKNLLEQLHRLGILKGVKEYLEDLVEFCKGLNMDNYADGDEKDAFLNALKKAEDVLADENATDIEIEAAYWELYNAAEKLTARDFDKSELWELILIARDVVSRFDEYVEAGKDQLEAMLTYGVDIYEKTDATEEEVKDAITKLANALAAMRYKANKAYLKSALLTVDSLDLSIYTDDSVSALMAVVETAQKIMKDPTLTKEEDQAWVDKITIELLAAIENLAEKIPVTDDTEESKDTQKPSDTEEDTQKGTKSTDGKGSDGKNGGKTSPKTGDTSTALLAHILILNMAGAAMILLLKKRKTVYGDK